MKSNGQTRDSNNPNLFLELMNQLNKHYFGIASLLENYVTILKTISNLQSVFILKNTNSYSNKLGLEITYPTNPKENIKDQNIEYLSEIGLNNNEPTKVNISLDSHFQSNYPSLVIPLIFGNDHVGLILITECENISELIEFHKNMMPYLTLLFQNIWLKDKLNINEKQENHSKAENNFNEEIVRQSITYLESIQMISDLIQKANNVEELIDKVIHTTLKIFNCDRAFLLYPCDPDAKVTRVPIEVARPEFPGANILNIDVPVDEIQRDIFRSVLNSEKPIILDEEILNNFADDNPDLAEQQFIMPKSAIITSFHPKVDKPWMFGLHQCSYNRNWSDNEVKLFIDIAYRLGEAINTLVIYKNLKISEKKYRSLFMESISGFALTEAVVNENDGVIDYFFLDVNPSFEDLLCQKREFVIGKTVGEILPDLKETLYTNFKKTALSGEKLEVEEYSKSLDKYFYISAYKPADKQLALLFNEITAKIKAELELKKEKDFNELIFNNVKDTIFIFNPLTGEPIKWNRAFKQISGYSDSEIKNRKAPNDWYSRTELIKAKSIVKKLIKNEDQVLEMNLISKSGDLIPTEYTSSLIKDNKSDTFIVSVGRDITERKKNEFLLKESERLKQEMHLAQRIQTTLIPPEIYHKELEIAAKMIPAKEVGGDYYDIFTDQYNRLWFAIGDVSGHGLTPGMIMMMAQTSVFSTILHIDSDHPKSAIISVNKTLYHNVRNRMKELHFMSLSLMLYLGNGKFIHAGGHESIIIYRNNTKEFERIKSNGVFLSLREDITGGIEDGSFELNNEDLMVLYTDGIIEAKNKQNELLGIERLYTFIQSKIDEPCEKIKEHIINETLNWSNEQILDDMTIILVRKRS